MILYFSGTGNSEYVAKRISKATGDECLDLFDRIRGHDVSPIHAERPLVVVAPTYAWRLPRIVESWLEATPITGTKQIYFVLTCGETIGNAGQYLADLCRKKQMAYAGCLAIVMPENYIALFPPPRRNRRRRSSRRQNLSSTGRSTSSSRAGPSRRSPFPRWTG